MARDVYLRRYATEAQPLLKFEDGLGSPRTSSCRSDPAGARPRLRRPRPERVGFAREVIEPRCSDARSAPGYLTYDDMLTRLRAALADPQYGDLAAQRLRQRFPVVLVDEFQDTDPIQWEILRRAFHRHSTLVVIGDPKQAIYAFRGADVNSYLQVARSRPRSARWSTASAATGRCWTGSDLIMGDASLGDPAIVVRPVGSARPRVAD